MNLSFTTSTPNRHCEFLARSTSTQTWLCPFIVYGRTKLFLADRSVWLWTINLATSRAPNPLRPCPTLPVCDVQDTSGIVARAQFKDNLKKHFWNLLVFLPQRNVSSGYKCAQGPDHTFRWEIAYTDEISR